MKKILFLCFTLLLGAVGLAQIVDIPDANFKNALVNTFCVDTNNDGFGDADADTNNDGEIQVTEALAVLRLHVNDEDIIDLEGIQEFSNLIKLKCDGNDITSFDLSQNVQLEFLDCGYNPLPVVDISQNPNLILLGVHNTLITSIDLSQNTNLDYLLLRSNLLSEIDVSHNPNLRVLNCTYNQINTINVSQNPLLTDLDINDNLITSLDVSQNPVLKRVICNNNQLTSLNLENGANELFIKMMAFDNPNLNCIQVDDLGYAESQICDGPTSLGWCKDATAVYSEDCSLGVDEFPLNNVVIYPNPVQSILTISSENMQIEALNLYDSRGVLLKKRGPIEGSSTLDVSSLASGLYFITITSKGKTISKKFIKE